MVVVEEPAVKAGFPDCRLNRVEIRTEVHTGHDTRLGTMAADACCRRILPLKFVLDFSVRNLQDWPGA